MATRRSSRARARSEAPSTSHIQDTPEDVPHYSTDDELQPQVFTSSRSYDKSGRLIIHNPYYYQEHVDPSMSFFYTPHSILTLVLVLGYMCRVAFMEDTRLQETTVGRVVSGFLAASAVFIIIGALQFGNGPLIRPHPVVWRIALAISVIYELVLVFLMFQSVHDVRRWLGILDPSLGKPLPERSYAEDCSITWETLSGQVDIFVLAHVLGWYGKMLMLRDQWFCWILSVMFELCEYSLQHQLPNFAECWWDHWILDVLVCNWLGIYLGLKTCEYFEMKTYSWRGIGEYKTVRGKMGRTIAQFTPHSWTSFHWGSTKTLANFMFTLFLLIFFLEAELNSFYIKALLWMPSEHIFNTLRLCLFGMIGAVSVRELYQYLVDKRCKRLGPQAWIGIAIVVSETLLCVKFGRGAFPKPFPLWVQFMWLTIVLFLVLYALFQFWYRPRWLQWRSSSVSSNVNSIDASPQSSPQSKKRGRSLRKNEIKNT